MSTETMTTIACTLLVASLLLLLLLSRSELAGPPAVLGFVFGAAFAGSIAFLTTQPA